MKVIEPSIELMRDFEGEEVMKFIEKCGRTCYQSEKNITADSAEKFVRNLIKRGHESVLEHFSVTFKIICDRGVMAELTRHRLASFSIESTRYNAYDELTFIKPCFWNNLSTNFERWQIILKEIEYFYKSMRVHGAKPEEARAILPNSLKTEIVMTANLREWRHILKLRCDKAAHPQMRQIAFMLLDILKEKLPVVFEDIGEVRTLEKNVAVVCKEKDGLVSAKTLAKIAKIVQDSECKCSLTRRNKTVKADSILYLMSLGIQNGDTVTVKCDDENCVEKVCKILQDA